jgi:hypothetical protein
MILSAKLSTAKNYVMLKIWPPTPSPRPPPLISQAAKSGAGEMDTLKTPVIKVEIFTMMAPSLLGRQYRQWPATASLTNRLLAQHNWAGWGGGWEVGGRYPKAHP